VSVERHRIHEGDIGAYLLRALPPVEEQRFEAHLDECPVCQDEVARLRPAVAALARSVPPVVPPPSLKAGLMEIVDQEAHEREKAVVTGRSPAARQRLRGRLGELAAAFRLRPTAGWAAASAVLLVGFVCGAAGVYALTEAGSDDGSGSVVAQAQIDRTRVPSASGSLVVPGERRDGAVLRVHGMPELEPDSVYQVWLQRDGEVISQSLFHVGDNGDGAAAVAGDLKGADAVLVTRESAGGAKAPTEKPIIKVPL
jgi:anti-sigma factor RsiW